MYYVRYIRQSTLTQFSLAFYFLSLSLSLSLFLKIGSPPITEHEMMLYTKQFCISSLAEILVFFFLVGGMGMCVSGISILHT